MNAGTYAVIRINGEKVVTLKSGGYGSVQLEPGTYLLAVHGAGALAAENKYPQCQWNIQISSSDVRYFKWDAKRTHPSYGPFICSEVGTFESEEVALEEIASTSLLPVETPVIPVIKTPSERSEDLNINASKINSLPTDLGVEVFMPNELHKKIDIPATGNSNWNPGYLLSPAASKTFPQVFSRYKFTREDTQGVATEKVSSPTDILVTLIYYEAKVSDFWGTHSVNITVKIFQSNGEEIGEFSGTGRINTGVTLAPGAFEDAFVEAFLEILQQLVENAIFIEIVEQSEP
jgi:hypothetical protein